MSETEKLDLPTPEDAESEDKGRRKITGNLPYTTSIGVFEGILKKLLTAERPDKFSADFVDKVLGYSGGSARAAIPIMKKLRLLDSSGSPTELYTSFRSDRTRGKAAYTALKNGFGEIFRRSEYAHKADDNDLKEIIAEVTGLPSNDTIVKYILNTFNAVKLYVRDSTLQEENAGKEDADNVIPDQNDMGRSSLPGLGLSYHINIVLPETSDINVFNAIFKSLKSNLL